MFVTCKQRVCNVILSLINLFHDKRVLNLNSFQHDYVLFTLFIGLKAYFDVAMIFTYCSALWAASL